MIKQKKWWVSGGVFSLLIILGLSEFIKGSSAPRERYCQLSLERQVADAAAIYVVQVNHATAYNTHVDGNEMAEPCLYNVSLVETLKQAREQSSFNNFSVVNVRPNSALTACKKPGESFLLLLRTQEPEQGDHLECRHAAIVGMAERNVVQNIFAQKGN